MSFDLSIKATDASDLYRQIRDLAGPAVLEGYADEALLTEVRQRMAKKGLVVILKPFDESAVEGEAAAGGDDTPEPPKTSAKRGPKPKAPAPEAAAPVQTEKVVEAAPDEAKVATIDDVRAALNAYAAIHGQMPARAVMQKTGESVKLTDIKADKYPALIEALKVAA